MTELQFQDEVLDRLQERNPRFHARSYEFVMMALQSVIRSLDEPRHITGRELTEGVRELAIGRYGLLARAVLEHWGITGSSDFGEIVFNLVRIGRLKKSENDRLEDFDKCFDFADAFERRFTIKVPKE